jgi:hypothetical protein
VVDGLLSRVSALFGEHPEGWLDDSNTGRGQVDMYMVDAYLFAEPFADRLGEVWDRGLASAARLVAAVASPGGAALPWGRSIGALAVCHSAELAALLLRRAAESEGGPGRSDAEGAGLARRAAAGVGGAGSEGAAGRVEVERWWALARSAADGAAGWFDDGLVVAHKRRAPFRYRGPFRRLQMTLDCLGKLVVAALDLRRAGDVPAPGPAPAAAFPAGDSWLGFGPGLGVWARRDPRLSFALPVVGGPGVDYAPSPRHPGTFDVPTDQPLTCFVPLAWRGETRFAPGGPAAAVAHRPGGLDLDHDGFWSTSAPLGEVPSAWRAGGGPGTGSRAARWWSTKTWSSPSGRRARWRCWSPSCRAGPCT